MPGSADCPRSCCSSAPGSDETVVSDCLKMTAAEEQAVAG